MYKKILSSFANILFYAVLVVASVVVASSMIQKAQGAKLPMTFGWGSAVILTGSMEPSIPTRSYVVVHKTDEIKEGDIITYDSEDSSWPVTHRIQKIEGETITTQGDANNIADDPILREQVLGKVVLVLSVETISIVLTGIIAFAVIGFTVSSVLFGKRKTE